MKGLNNDYNFSFLIDGYKLAFVTLIEQAIKLPEDEIVQRDFHSLASLKELYSPSGHIAIGYMAG